MSADYVIVLTTFPVDQDADGFARALVSEHLAACVNVLPPVRSIYRWKGAIESADEHQLVIKTSAARIRDLESRLKSLHPYEVPEFLVLSISGGSPEYLSWLSESTSQ